MFQKKRVHKFSLLQNFDSLRDYKIIQDLRKGFLLKLKINDEFVKRKEPKSRNERSIAMNIVLAYDKTLSMEYSNYWNNHWYVVIVFSDTKSRDM